MTQVFPACRETNPGETLSFACYNDLTALPFVVINNSLLQTAVLVKLIVVRLVKKLQIYGIKVLLPYSQSTPYLSLYWSKVIHSSHYIFKSHFSIILPFTVIFCELSLTFRVPKKKLQAFLTSYASATCPAYLTLIDLIILIPFDEEYKLLISVLRRFSLCRTSTLVQGPTHLPY